MNKVKRNWLIYVFIILLIVLFFTPAFFENFKLKSKLTNASGILNKIDINSRNKPKQSQPKLLKPNISLKKLK